MILFWPRICQDAMNRSQACLWLFQFHSNHSIRSTRKLKKQIFFSQSADHIISRFLFTWKYQHLKLTAHANVHILNYKCRIRKNADPILICYKRGLLPLLCSRHWDWTLINTVERKYMQLSAKNFKRYMKQWR